MGVDQAQAMRELVDVVGSSRPDGFTPSIVKQTKDYLYVEYKSPFLGFVDDGASTGHAGGCDGPR